MSTKEISIPEGVKVELQGLKLKLEGPLGKVEKDLSCIPGLKIELVNNKLRLTHAGRKSRAVLNTAAAHLRNAVTGVTKGYTYELRIVYSHFPIRVSIEGSKFVIQNFLGERFPRVASVLPGVKVSVEGSEVRVSGIEKDAVAQTAANIEQACRIKAKDLRRFQDGIWIVGWKVGMHG